MAVIRSIRHKSFPPIAIIIFVSFQLYFFYNYSPKAKAISAYAKLQLTASGLIGAEPNTPSKIFLNDKSYIASPYEKLLEHYGDTFPSLDYDAKCKAYFEGLYKDDSAWEVGDFSKLPFDRTIFETKSSFIENKIKEYKSKLKQGLTEEEIKKIVAHEQLEQLYEIEYQKSIKDAHNLEQKLIDSNTHMRAYGACFLEQYGPFTTKFNKIDTSVENNDNILHDKFLCHDIEVRMFQWLTQQYPTFTRWDGEIVAGHMPIISNYVNEEGLAKKSQVKEQSIFESNDEEDDKTINGCFLKRYRDSLNGKGFVISAADKHADQLASLIGSLRALGNKLPIQVVHSGDLSKEAIEALIKIGRNLEDLNFKHVDRFESIFKSRNITLDNDIDQFSKLSIEELSIIFPKQEMWFVDISKSISKKHRAKFNTYGNKLLAYFFNSFQHAILVDTDTVPMVDFDQHILNSTFYKETGAHFFRDRELYTQIKSTDSIFYQKLMPSIMDTAIFGIPEISDFTLKNRFISKRFDHYMESGVVAIDRIKHFTGVLQTVQLQMWMPVTSRIWGDKELFWLALSMVGDENYFMNNWPAGAVGQITPKKYRLANDGDDTRRNKLVGNEICSTHPAHISSEDNSTLLWFNSGFTYCKHEGAANQDFTTPLFKTWYDSKDAVAKLYSSYHKIESAVVPKSAEYYVRDSGTGENERGWIKGTQCSKFLYCAYDKVGGKDVDESNGLLINFDNETRGLYDFYGSVNQNAIEIFQGKKTTK